MKTWHFHSMFQSKKSRKISAFSDKNSKLFQETSSHNNLFARLKGVLILGKAIGIIPCEGIFQPDFRRFRFRRWSIGSFTSVIIVSLLGVNVLVSLAKMYRANKQNAVDFARSGTSVAFYLYGSFAYCYFLLKATELTNLFYKWNTLDLKIHLQDKTLSRDAGIITGLVFTSAVLENLVLEFTQFSIEFGKKNSTHETLQAHYEKSYRSWARLVPYHWTWSILAFVSNKLALYGWNFVEILIAVLSRAFSEKFKLLNEAVENDITKQAGQQSSEKLQNEKFIWANLALDHSAICALFDQFERFLSPLVFCSYGIDIYYSCLLLLLSLVPGDTDENKKSTLYAIYAAWSFLHLIGRLYIMSVYAAAVNSHAHDTTRVLRCCPMAYCTKEIERIEMRLKKSSAIGITGLGCFTITKPFILSIIGVVFTFEIVLLQSYPQPLPANCCVP